MSTTASAPHHLVPPSAPLLCARGLQHSFGMTRALAGVDLAVPAGQTLAVMGPSGSGKSTLLHVMAGITRPDAGTVQLDGADISAMPDRERSSLRRTRFGFVFQFGQLLPELPADENVALPLMLAGTRRGDAVRIAREWLGRLGLDGLQGRRPGEMSGGQAQRVAVARALVTSPSVVFADEPTGSLDQRTGWDVMQLLTTTCRISGAALLVVTHDPHVAGWCRRVVEVRDGLVVSDRATPAAADGFR